MDKTQEFKSTIKINGTIDEELFNKFDEASQKIIEAYNSYLNDVSLIKEEFISPFPEILIEINSGGGYTHVGSAILDKLQEMKDMGIKLHTHAVGACMSMAFIIYLIADKRSGGKYCRWMNHGSSMSCGGYVEEIKSSIEDSEEMEALFEEIILKQTKIPKERIERARNRADFFGYKTAIELGVVNYYEGCELEEEEMTDKVSQAIVSSIMVFSQMMNMDKAEAIDLMTDILIEAKETREDERCFKTEKCNTCEDKEECLDCIMEKIEICKSENDCNECEEKDECEDSVKFIDNIRNNNEEVDKDVEEIEEGKLDNDEEEEE